MLALSDARKSVPVLEGLTLIHRGKVRDTYDLGNHRLLSVASDGVSIFDFVLNATVPDKGSVLTALTLFWAQLLQRYGIADHILAAGAQIDQFLDPDELRSSPSIQARSLVIQQLNMVPVEFVARACLAGSGLKSYKATGEVCGHKLPEGLQDGDELPYLLDTPTTKAQDGHDEPLPAEITRRQYPGQTERLLEIFQIARHFARSRGIIIADTKLEFGLDGTLADEVLTPDSSRFWDAREWDKSRLAATGRKSPPSLDKQLVREWGKSVGIDKLTDPSDSAQVAHVQGLTVPQEVLEGVRQAYRYIFWRLTGRRLEHFWQEQGVALEAPRYQLGILVGSTSDLPAVAHAVRANGWAGSRVQVHVVSCHRNPHELLNFVKSGCGGATAIIAAAGMAAALPGVLDALIRAEGKAIPVIGVALGEAGTRALEAARLSIEQLPGSPVILREDGTAYSGSAGIEEAMERLQNGELPPPKSRVSKPSQFNVKI